jgi:4-hydroxythreonine-4-phosphate dehydrogenase
MTVAERPSIAISIGDPAGIGPEVTWKALREESIRRLARWIVVGEGWIIANMEQLIGHVPHRPFDSALTDDDSVFVLSTGKLDESQFAYGRISQACGAAGLEYVRIASELCIRGQAEAIVTAPLNKEAVAMTGIEFHGHTEFIAELCGVDESRMMLVNDGLSVVHATTHVSLAEATRLDAARIEKTIELADDAYTRLRGARPRIAVCGLNPHAGENGMFGDQESKTIAPAVEAAKDRGIDCCGPYPADTLFLQAFRGAYDVVVAMYHDQGHIPMKLMDFEHTVNVTLGLPIIRTSVDHGTAFDIAGKNLASADDMQTAMQLAVRMVHAGVAKSS